MFHNENDRKQREEVSDDYVGERKKKKEREAQVPMNLARAKAKWRVPSCAHASGKRKGTMKAIYIAVFRPSQWHSGGRGGD